MKKWVFGLLAFVVVGGAAYWFLGREDPTVGPKYETIVVARGDVSEIVSGSGTVEPAATTAVRVVRPGTVTSVSAVEGSAVGSGDELFRVDGQPVYALVTDTPIYRTLTSGADGDDVRVLQEFLRDLGYYDGPIDADYGGGSQEAVRDFLEDRDLERNARVGGETFQSVGSSTLGRPIVAAVSIAVGDTVQPGLPALVTRPDGALDAVISINEVDIPRVEVGQQAVIRLDALPDREFSGEVVEVSTGLVAADGVPSAAASGGAGVVTFPVTVRITGPPAEIKAGMSVDVDIVLSTAADVLAVPTGAVQEKDGETVVLLPGEPLPDGSEGTPVPTKVDVGLRSDDMVEVTGGLEEGQTIIVGLDVESLELPSSGLFSGPQGPPGSDEGDD